MSPKKKYYDTKREAKEALAKANPAFQMHVWKMPKGSRHVGKYAVCDEMEFLNTH